MTSVWYPGFVQKMVDKKTEWIWMDGMEKIATGW